MKRDPELEDFGGRARELVRSVFRENLRPPERLRISEWAEKYRILAGRAASEPGKWRNSRTPYSVAIMDALSPHDPCKRVTLMKGSQVGGTEIGNNWIGYTIDADPTPLIMVLPVEQLAKRTSRQRIDPMIRAMPRLRSKVVERAGRKAGNTTYEKEYPNGILVLTWATSEAGLLSTPAPRVMKDELDAYEEDIAGHGDPGELVERATRTFPNAKIYEVSTPTIEGRSRIAASFEDGDQSFFYVPCPRCGERQRLTWPQIRWDSKLPKPERYDRVWYECEHCGGAIEEHEKTAMLAGGEWIATHPERSRSHRSFHLSALYSPAGWLAWGGTEGIVAWFEKAKSVPAKLRVWVNQALGECYREKGQAPEWERLYRRREKYAIRTVPKRGLVLTCGVDVQIDRLELEVLAWGRGMESWSVAYEVLAGDPAAPQVWNELDRIRNRSWPHESGAELTIQLTAVDSGYETQTVYDYARRRGISSVIAVKGVDNQTIIVAQPKAVEVTPKGKRRRRGGRVWPIGLSLIKAQLYGWANLEAPLEENEPFPPGFCHWPQYGEGYFKQFCNEELVSRVVRGFRRYIWEKTGPNEAFDCRVYNRAAAAVVGIDRYQEDDWDRIERTLGMEPTQEPPPIARSRRIRKRGGGLDRWRS